MNDNPITADPAPCSCELAGYCDRFKRQMSSRMHHQCKSSSRYRMAFESAVTGKPMPVLEPPKLVTKITSFADAYTNWVAVGRPTRTSKQVEECFAICRSNTCNQFLPIENDPNDGVCRFCGCGVKNGAGMLNKIKMATEDCPLGLWPKVEDSK